VKSTNNRGGLLMAKKQGCKIRNWKDYNRTLVQRGSITLWFDEKSIKKWHKPKHNRRGRPRVYADAAILCMLTLKMVFRLPLRATQGLVASIIELLGLPIAAANYTTVCRRQKYLKPVLQTRATNEPLHAVFDATGLKVFGEGEWKTKIHGYSKRRTWRKLHLGADEATGEIIAEVLTGNDKQDGELLPDLLEQIDRLIAQASGDGAYDSFNNYDLLKRYGIKPTIPTRENAKIRQHGNSHNAAIARDEVLREIRRLGLKRWKQQHGYHRRSLAETAMSRFKRLLGDRLQAILFESQAVEATIKCNILNKMSAIKNHGCYNHPTG
jgi:hypothetical protein